MRTSFFLPSSLMSISVAYQLQAASIKSFNVFAEIAKMTPTAINAVAPACLEGRPDSSAIASAWLRMGGLKAFDIMLSNSQAIYSISASIEKSKLSACGMTAEDVAYFKSKAEAIEQEFPLVVTEDQSYSPTDSPPMLHILRTMVLYCEVVGRIFALAENWACPLASEMLVHI